MRKMLNKILPACLALGLICVEDVTSSDYIVDLMNRFLEATPIHPQLKTPDNDIWAPESNVRSQYTKDEPYSSTFVPSKDCGESILNLKLGDYGTITSPNYPRNYPGRKSCEWQLQGPPGSRIQAVMLDSVTQPKGLLYSDFIMFGKSGNFSVVDRLSGDLSAQTPMKILSEANRLGIRFRSNMLFSFRGFKLQYLVIPDQKEVVALRKFSKTAYDGVCGLAFADYPHHEGDNAPSPSETSSGSSDSDSETDHQEFPIIKPNNRIPNKKFLPVVASKKAKPFYGQGGVDVLKYAYPWMVALLIDDKHFCAGSIIDDRHILTAAHCTYRIQKVTMMLGSYKIKVNRNEPDDGRSIFEVTRRHIFQHPEYNPNSHAYDISIIRLPDNQKIEFSDRVRPVCLPNRHYIAKDFINEPASVSGWGQFDDSATRASPYLKENDVTVIPTGQCRVAFRGIVNGNLVCTSTSPHSSPCKGDSGGPLVVKQESDSGPFYMQIGVLSFGAATCQNGLPVGFTRVSAFLDFINEVTGKNL